MGTLSGQQVGEIRPFAGHACLTNPAIVLFTCCGGQQALIIFTGGLFPLSRLSLSPWGWDVGGWGGGSWRQGGYVQWEVGGRGGYVQEGEGRGGVVGGGGGGGGAGVR